MRVHVSSAPCCFGVFETNVEEDIHPEPTQLLTLMRECGYAGTELGPPGYLGDGETVAARLSEAHLQLAGSFMMFRLSRDAAFREDFEALDQTLVDLRAAAGDNPLPVVLIADAFGAEPDRMLYASTIEHHPETWLSAERSLLLVANLQRVAERCREYGFECSLHPDYGSYIETQREVEMVLEATDRDLLGLCLDTGNAAFAGSEPLQVLKSYGDVVNHVHLKDIDRGLLTMVQERGEGVEGAWDAGVFCALGNGDAQVDECLTELERLGYEGWLVVEHDQELSAHWSLRDATEVQRANRVWLADRGL